MPRGRRRGKGWGPDSGHSQFLCKLGQILPYSLSFIIWGKGWWGIFATFGLLGGFLGNTCLPVTFKSSVPSESVAEHR